jgi:hypothetical protein
VNPRTELVIFKIFPTKKWRKIGVFIKLLLVFSKNDNNIGFLEKRQFFLAENLQQIAENCDYNIDPPKETVNIF